MAVSEDKHHTIRTLHDLGFSMRCIAASIGVDKTTLWREFRDIVGEDTVGNKMKLSQYKNATLTALSIETEEDRTKIAALNALDTSVDDQDAPVTDAAAVVDIKAEILDELSS